MNQIYSDNNNILSCGSPVQTGKQYSRSFFGSSKISYDHTVLVYHKGKVGCKQWKDVGSGLMVMQQRSLLLPAMYSLGIVRIGYDIHAVLDTSKDELVHVGTPDILVVPFISQILGQSSQAFVMPQYDSMLVGDALFSFLFGIALAHGKWRTKDDMLYPIQITLPLTSSLLGRKEFFVELSAACHARHILHTMQFVFNGTYEIVYITMHDPAILQQFVQWLNPVVKIGQISTVRTTQKVFDALVTYTQQEGLQLPIQQVADIVILAAD